jgi:cold shock CspA family protein
MAECQNVAAGELKSRLTAECVFGHRLMENRSSRSGFRRPLKHIQAWRAAESGGAAIERRVSDMREGGEIVTYFENRGFGFIRPDYSCGVNEKGGGDVFLHVDQVMSGIPEKGKRCMFEAALSGRRQRLVAQDVEIL